MPLVLKATPARSAFKKMLGQNNHFLITILVGLDAVESGQANLSPEFSTSWSPINAHASARRSRDFATKALLAWASTALDTYRRQLSTPTNVYLSIGECDAIKAEEGLGARLQRLSQLVGAVMGPEKELVELLVVWRNRVVHTNARDVVSGGLKRRLLANQALLAKDYQGLNIERAMEGARRGNAPKFKEITALVRAAHIFVREIDKAILARVDLDKCLLAVLSTYVSEDPVKRCRNIWGRDAARRRRSIMQVAQSYGMSQEDGTEWYRTSSLPKSSRGAQKTHFCG
ncbi:hypothetical protein [Mycobacterium sp. E735]|uniref:hypothetical protein n=1 Tax=Mycobacterium sp. E735 TaxID=1834148 RepID=UPI0012EA0AC3|nr:hypothetical protein [Mycobacterium sp. E735]